MSVTALFDAHCDTASEMLKSGEVLLSNTLQTDLVRGSAYYPRGQVYALWQHAESASPTELTERFWRIFENLLFEIKKNKSVVTLCTTKQEIAEAFQSRRQAAIISCEGAELIGCDLEAFTRAHSMGLRILNLCWNNDNELCGAAMGSGKGLSERGKDFVRLAARLGIIIDLSHASDKTAWDILKLDCAKVMASHSNCRSIFAHPRNLPDDLLREIALSGGVVGLNLYPPFLGGNSISLAARHVTRMMEICGERAVCLGCDFDGVTELPLGVRGIEDMNHVFDALVSCGIPCSSVKNIFFGNLMKFWERAL